MARHAERPHPDRDPNATVYALKVALTDNKSIWRRIAIRSDQTLDDLHAVIFRAFDRFDEHLYSFHLQPVFLQRGPYRHRDNVEFTSPVMIEEATSMDGHEVRDASETTIGSLELVVQGKLYYLFDFGDSWWHELTVEQVQQPVEARRRYPFVLEKYGNSPPQYPPAEE
jgi:hypothetical protein